MTYSSVNSQFGAVGRLLLRTMAVALDWAARNADSLELLFSGELRKSDECQTRLAGALTDSACVPHESTRPEFQGI